jgi:hypothetical protein
MKWVGVALNRARRVKGSDGERATRATELEVAADVEAALLVSAAALRRLGMTITRYEIDAGQLEARARDRDGGGGIKLTITAEGENLSRMQIESDVAGAGRLFRLFKRELGRKP